MRMQHRSAIVLVMFGALAASVSGQEISFSFGPDWEDGVGIDYADGLFWIADNYLGFDGLNSRIHLFDPDTGTEVGVFDSPVTTRVGARDIVVVGDSIFQPEDSTNLIHRFSKVDGSLIESFSHDGRFPWGIASDQTHLFILETESPQQIQKRAISSPTYPFVSRFPWPSPRQTGLTFVQGHLYRILTNTGTDPVQRLDPDTGLVLETIPLPPALEAQLQTDVAVVRDLVYDGSHFWFHLRLTPGPDKLVRAPSGWGGLSIDFEEFEPSDHGTRFGRDTGIDYAGFAWGYADPVKQETWGSWTIVDSSVEVPGTNGSENWLKARAADVGKGAKITRQEGFVFESMKLYTDNRPAFLSYVLVTYRTIDNVTSSGQIIDLEDDQWISVTANDLGVDGVTLKALWFNGIGITNPNGAKFGLDDFTYR